MYVAHEYDSPLELFVDDAGTSPVRMRLPAVAGIASSVALLSVESSSAAAW